MTAGDVVPVNGGKGCIMRGMATPQTRVKQLTRPSSQTTIYGLVVLVRLEQHYNRYYMYVAATWIS